MQWRLQTTDERFSTHLITIHRLRFRRRWWRFDRLGLRDEWEQLLWFCELAWRTVGSTSLSSFTRNRWRKGSWILKVSEQLFTGWCCKVRTDRSDWQKGKKINTLLVWQCIPTEIKAGKVKVAFKKVKNNIVKAAPKRWRWEMLTLIFIVNVSTRTPAKLLIPLMKFEVGSSPRYLFWRSKLHCGVWWGGMGRGPPFTTSPFNTVFFAMMTADLLGDGGISGSW